MLLGDEVKLNEVKGVECNAQHGKWSDWIETEDSNCTFNENTEIWTKKATRTCSPEPLFGGICQGTYLGLIWNWFEITGYDIWYDLSIIGCFIWLLNFF